MKKQPQARKSPSTKPSRAMFELVRVHNEFKDLGTLDLNHLLHLNTSSLMKSGLQLTSLLEQVKKTKAEIARLTRESEVLSGIIANRV